MITPFTVKIPHFKRKGMIYKTNEKTRTKSSKLFYNID